MRWDLEFAKLFKQRDNPRKIGSVIGEVISVTPLRIKILNGSVILDGNFLYKRINSSFAMGSKVLLIPSESEQVFFVIDEFEKVGV